jgi:acyl-homoserine-lactone acylase
MDLIRGALALAASGLLGACALSPAGGGAEAQVQRTAHGVVHVSAPDLQTLAYGVAYAHAQDNVCQTAQQLVTIRGQRSRWFGAGQAQMGLRVYPNEQIDLFIAAHMDDAALARADATTSADAQAMAAGYVAGYNRFLADHAGRLPVACNGQPWVQPMTRAELRRLGELSAVQIGIGLMADAMLGARPPAPAQAVVPAPVDLADAAAAMREAGVIDSPYGSNAWALGRDVTASGRGLLLGNPHFPWTGVNRFWQLHLTVPGQLDVMGASLGHTAVVQIGFNKDVAWSHTVSTGKRFTLHELQLVAGEPTRYVVDGKPVAMQSRTVAIDVRAADGSLQRKSHTVWTTRWGPVIVNPRAGLNWTDKLAYALQDANVGNVRGTDTWLQLNRARNLADMRQALARLGTPWVNTIAVDRHGDAMVADASVVPDVDEAHLSRCAPSKPAQALLRAAGLVVLDGSRSDCDWRRDPASAVPGLIPLARLPVVRRTDWAQNSNDSFAYTHPAVRLSGISPLVGDGVLRGPRTRSSLIELPELLAEGKVTPAALQARLFGNRNLLAQLVLPDLLTACTAPPSDDVRDGCIALRGWDRRNNVDSRGAHLFREFWRAASAIPGVYATPYDPAAPVATPRGLKMADAAVADKVWSALAAAVRQVRSAGFALDAPWGSVQRPAITRDAIALHGGDNLEGVLNNLGARGDPVLGRRGVQVDYGTSYVQTVGFDDRGPVAQALLTYGQSSDPASAHATDQLQLYARKVWPTLPFHAEDVVRQRVGEALRLVRP